jgi:hypothetical protein
VKKKGHCISPQTYNPDMKCVSNTRYDDISVGIGFGNRSLEKFLASKSGIPGPGQYNLPSVFDLKRKYKVSLN